MNNQFKRKVENSIIKLFIIFFLSSLLVGSIIRPQKKLPVILPENLTKISRQKLAAPLDEADLQYCSPGLRIFLEKNFLYAYAFIEDYPMTTRNILINIQSYYPICAKELPGLQKRILPLQEKILEATEP